MGKINDALHKMYDKCQTWDVFEIMRIEGITYYHENSFPKGVRGQYTSDGKTHVIIVSNDIHTDKEQDVIAHELGHYYMHQPPFTDKDLEVHTADGKNRKEYEADQFAICISLKCFDAVEYEDSSLYHGNYKVIDHELGIVIGESPIMDDNKAVPNVKGCFVKFNVDNIDPDAETIYKDAKYKTGKKPNATLSRDEFRLIQMFRQLNVSQQQVLLNSLPRALPD